MVFQYSVNLCAGLFDDLAPTGNFVFDQRGELLGCTTGGIGAFVTELLEQFGTLQRCIFALAAFWNNSLVRCATVPLPGEAKLSEPG